MYSTISYVLEICMYDVNTQQVIKKNKKITLRNHPITTLIASLIRLDRLMEEGKR